MLHPVRKQAPTDLPVSLATAKLHLRIDPEVNLEDELVLFLIQAATDHLDGWTGTLGRCLAKQVWEQAFESDYGCLHLPLGPVLTVDSIAYPDEGEGTETDEGFVTTTDAGGRTYIRVANPTGKPVVVTYTAGHEVDDIPPAIRQAILLFVGAWYENREETAIGVSVSALPESVAAHALLRPYRRTGF